MKNFFRGKCKIDDNECTLLINFNNILAIDIKNKFIVNGCNISIFDFDSFYNKYKKWLRQNKKSMAGAVVDLQDQIKNGDSIHEKINFKDYEPQFFTKKEKQLLFHNSIDKNYYGLAQLVLFFGDDFTNYDKFYVETIKAINVYILNLSDNNCMKNIKQLYEELKLKINLKSQTEVIGMYLTAILSKNYKECFKIIAEVFGGRKITKNEQPMFFFNHEVNWELKKFSGIAGNVEKIDFIDNIRLMEKYGN